MSLLTTYCVIAALLALLSLDEFGLSLESVIIAVVVAVTWPLLVLLFPVFAAMALAVFWRR